LELTNTDQEFHEHGKSKGGGRPGQVGGHNSGRKALHSFGVVARTDRRGVGMNNPGGTDEQESGLGKVSKAFPEGEKGRGT